MILVDLMEKTVSLDGVRVRLTRTEYKLVSYLYTNRGRLVTQSELSEAVWGPGWEKIYDSVYVYISRVRAKLGFASIRSHRKGYSWPDPIVGGS